MKKLILFLLNGFVVIACTGCQRDAVDKIMLKTARMNWFSLSGIEHHTYIINADGTGEVKWNLPPHLVDEPAWSADRQWVAFSTVTTEGNQAGGASHIYLMQSDGDHLVRIADDYSTNPAWSPDGYQIAYERLDKVYVLNVECLVLDQECNATSLFLDNGNSPDWSPDGKYVAYYSSESRGINIIATDGNEEPLNLKEGEGCITPKWSPDGTKIVAQCKYAIHVINVN